MLDVGTYIQRVALSNTKLVVMSGTKLDVYSIKDANLMKREVESVLRMEHSHTHKNVMTAEFVKSHQIRFRCKTICVALEHFSRVIVG
jgi:hypothetical protein